MKIAFAMPGQPATGAHVLFAAAGGKLLPSAGEVDAASGGAVTRALEAAAFKAGKGEILELFGLNGVEARRLVVAGVGKAEELDALGAEAVGAAIVAKLLTSGEKSVTVQAIGAGELDKLDPASFAARVGYGAALRSYRYDRYLTKQPESKKPTLEEVTVLAADKNAAEAAFAPLQALADAISFTRDLVTAPGNEIYPESYAREIQKLEKFGVEVEVLDVAAMEKLGMGALLGVGQGSANEPRLVVMHWKGGDADLAPLAFVGKGVTFDTGGISLKPGLGMEEMKYDMAGSAAVVGLMQALAARRAKVNAVGVVALVENMPSHKAQRPGDVVTSMSGQTIEVLNTDAEGRLVLADALWYTQDRFQPQFMINLATLTGAALVALGHEHAAIMANNDELAERLTAAGTAEGELVWRLPLSEAHDKEIDSKIADMKNIAGNRNAGTIIGGQFLQRFVNGVPWVHMDIAGTAWIKKDKATNPAGATAYGVRILNRLVSDHYEDQ